MTHHDASATADAWFCSTRPTWPRPDDETSNPAGFVLVIDDDPLRRAALSCAVLRVGRLAVLAASTRECRTIVAAITPAVIVLVPGPEGGVPEELLELLARSDRIACILIGPDGLESVVQQLPGPPGRVHVVPIPPAVDALSQVVRKYVPDLWAGPFSPAEYVQLAGLGAHSITLLCSSGSGEELGRIVMEGGRVRAARAGSKRGFEAFASLVTRTDARVRLIDVSADEAGEPDLEGNWQSLVLEAMRKYDEGLRGPQATPLGTDAEGRESDFSALSSEAPAGGRRHPLARAASVPALPVTEMRDALSSSRATPSGEVRDLIDEGVRAVIEQDYERAIHALERALALSPKNASVRHRLDRLYATVGRPT